MSPTALRKSAALSRSSSASSTTSTHASSSAARKDQSEIPASKRRTRKRISPLQLKMLEALFQRDTHPSREDRDALANTIGMESRSVTIWFQNKRQTARKIALHNATNMNNATIGSSDGSDSSSDSHSSSSLSSSSDAHTRVINTTRQQAPAPGGLRASAVIYSPYPSNPSSPSPSPPQSRHYAHFRSQTSMEWTKGLVAKEEEDEKHEAVTPKDESHPSDWPVVKAEEQELFLDIGIPVEEDMMKAALALCGLRG